MVKLCCILLAAAALLGACASDQPVDKAKQEAVNTPDVPKLTGFSDSTVLLEGKQPFVIPHFNDSTYTIVFCVRHAEKAADGSKNPPLTPEGQARAERLGAFLSKTRIDRIGSSNLKRNLQTAEAVKALTGQPELEVFAPELVFEWMQDLLVRNRGEHVLYIGHSNTIPELLNRLTTGPGYSDIPDEDYGRFYIVATRGLGESEVWEFRY